MGAVSHKMVAERWIAAGATVPLCSRVFAETLQKRHARKLSIPFSLSYFENMIRDAITTNAEPVQDDPETAKWKARVRGWMRDPALWRVGMWGENSLVSGCRVPPQILVALGVKVQRLGGKAKNTQTDRTKAHTSVFDGLHMAYGQ